jgi:hypothetical protein
VSHQDELTLVFDLVFELLGPAEPKDPDAR